MGKEGVGVAASPPLGGPSDPSPQTVSVKDAIANAGRVRGWLTAMVGQGEDRIWRGALLASQYLARVERDRTNLLIALEKIVAGDFNCSPHQRFMAAQGVAEDAIVNAMADTGKAVAS